MSELMLNVLDSERAIHGRLHGADVDRVVASLGADPTTIAELQLALGRFSCRPAGADYLSRFDAGLCREQWDAGIVFIDLAANLIVYRSTYSTFLQDGMERYDNDADSKEIHLPFDLSPDWLISESVEMFESLSAERRSRRATNEPLDERAVLYGRIREFIVRSIQERQGELRAADQDVLDVLLRDIHARWLLTPRDDLEVRSPRECMIDNRRKHLSLDMQNQQHHWSWLRQSPPGIPRESAAYRFGGFGTHEIVTYYDYVRDLLYEAARRCCSHLINEADLPGEAEHLQRFGQDWLHTPDPEFHGRTPASIMDRERRRLPEVARGDEAIIDPDCPCCQMLADEEMFGPAFWHLDGCNMDDEFAFSIYHRTREEWEEERRRDEEFYEDWSERREKRALDGEPF